MRRIEPSQGAVLAVVSIPMASVSTCVNVSCNPAAKFLLNSDFFLWYHPDILAGILARDAELASLA